MVTGVAEIINCEHVYILVNWCTGEMGECKSTLSTVSSFLTAHQHILGYLVPYNDVEDTVKEIRYNQGYLAMIKYE